MNWRTILSIFKMIKPSWALSIIMVLNLWKAHGSEVCNTDPSLPPLGLTQQIKILKPYTSADTVYTEVDQPAEFKGGIHKMYQFLGQNIRHPGFTSRNKVEGTVIGKFTVTIEGKIKDITIVQSLGKVADAEFIRVVKLMPKWEPGKKNGKPVNSEFQLPIRFE